MMLIVLLSFIVEDSATVDDANGCELGVLSQNLGVVVWRGIGSARYDALRSATGLDDSVLALHVVLAWPYHVWHDDGALSLLTARSILQG